MEYEDENKQKYKNRIICWTYRICVVALAIFFGRYLKAPFIDDAVAPSIVRFWSMAAIVPLTFLPITGLFSFFSTPPKRVQDLIRRIVLFTKGLSELSSTQYAIQDQNVPIINDSVKYTLACVDKFVDEAQSILTTRAHTNYVFGTCSITVALGSLHYIAFLALSSLKETSEILVKTIPNPNQFVIIRVFGALAFAAAAYAIVKTLISYGSSFFHEATRLLERRHALRFGRLYMYMKGEDYDFKELEGAFQWHMESNTVFQDISASKITDSTLNQLLKTVSEMANAAAKIKSKPSDD
jgi:hypothetical protein